MLRHFLKSKLQEVIVTQANIEYEGSITIDQDLMDAASIAQYERVEVNGKTSKSRITTYAIPGERGSGIIALNGGAALHFKIGDHVHVLCYAIADSNCVFTPTIVHTQNNKLL